MGVQTTPILESEPSLAPPDPHPTPMRKRRYAHFPSGQQLQAPDGSSQGYFTDCMICGQPFEQIADEIVIDFIHHSEYPGEPYYVKEARRKAFIEGMHAGTCFLIPWGVSQATACDGNVYAIPQGAKMTNATPTNLPLI